MTAASPDGPARTLTEVLDLRPLGTATLTVHGAPGDEFAEIGEPAREMFLGRSQITPHGRAFGGQVLAQSIMAAGLTIGTPVARQIHSLHAYFVRAGDSRAPIRFSVQRIRDGGSFSTRRVQAIQAGQTILAMTASFQERSDGLEHATPMPASPDPETLPTAAEILEGVEHPAAEAIKNRTVDVRSVEPALWLRSDDEQRTSQQVWMRVVEELPDDELVRAAALAYASDYTLLEPVLRGHGLSWSDPRLRVASLDHAMWFHRPVDPNDWILYAESSPSATGGRGLGTGNMFSRNGTHVVSVAQEGMVRVKEGAERFRFTPPSRA